MDGVSRFRLRVTVATGINLDLVKSSPSMKAALREPSLSSPRSGETSPRPAPETSPRFRPENEGHFPARDQRATSAPCAVGV